MFKFLQESKMILTPGLVKYVIEIRKLLFPQPAAVCLPARRRGREAMAA